MLNPRAHGGSRVARGGLLSLDWVLFSLVLLFLPPKALLVQTTWSDLKQNQIRQK
jgi:hypothetical protein